MYLTDVSMVLCCIVLCCDVLFVLQSNLMQCDGHMTVLECDVVPGKGVREYDGILM